MQVFKIEPKTSYSYGAAIVAATDLEEAINVYCSNEFRNYKYDEFECECKIVIDLYYKTSNPTLIFDKIDSE